MSQNQSYFWQTTRHNVYLKRSAKWHMLLAMMAVLTFSTICLAELEPKYSDETAQSMGMQTVSTYSLFILISLLFFVVCTIRTFIKRVINQFFFYWNSSDMLKYCIYNTVLIDKPLLAKQRIKCVENCILKCLHNGEKATDP